MFLMLIFVLLQANFRSTGVTLLVYANVPLAVTGGLVALFLRGLPLSISAAVGFIAVFGIAVMNGVVLVSCIRDLHRGGRTALESARMGSERRLRPVLMTALGRRWDSCRWLLRPVWAPRSSDHSPRWSSAGW
jgi:cobalt-zinc-cadmium resistance protein CzcA